ncbi:sulfite exporter TauE/SafE family protein [Aliigemmobacter aestuarii]|uniref:Probable membrane transporter protein n=1 Tax=Aliigemmobacter aestuarii TaxID=1445661 RepID=A0A4S3MPB7_9RHOB|nr:sulfite exporter TauE/SafE family protein [Gemmobacter aestuarii]THD84316.1 sulfite exporter TauE/SafE family protein [Gemmobacter aestuarii]
MGWLDPATLLPLVAALAVAGALIGFLAGIFGIGGGAISVPVFYEVFQTLGHPPEVAMPLAVGTSLAVIVPTSIQSSRGHFRRGTVDMDLLRLWALPVLVGVLLGAVIARYARPEVFQLVFVAVAAVNATKLLAGGSGWRLRDSLPSRAALRLYGGGVGLVSALMGIGGGAVSNLILTLHNVPIHRAVSTSAGVGVLIAIPGTLGYMMAGWGRTDLPADAIGFVSLATFALTIPTSLLTTRFGVALAHRLSRQHLERAFGLFLAAVCLRFLWAILAG